MRNYWIIGDIHGEIGLLDRLLENIRRFDPEQIVFVGDYIDRRPHTREVVDRIMDLDVPVACLMGNHEMMMLNAMEDMGFGYSPIELWYYNGGEATLQSFGFTSFFSFQSDMDPRYMVINRLAVPTGSNGRKQPCSMPGARISAATSWNMGW